MKEIIQNQKTYFKTGETKDVSFRKKQLQNLYDIIKDNESAIEMALYKDLGKPKFESQVTEIVFVLSEIKDVIKSLDKWSRVKKVTTPITLLPGRSEIHYEPFGNCLIIAPWNYPFQLAISPLIGAMAAGNTIIIKPSEVSSHTQDIIEKIINENFEPGYLKAICGGVEVSEELLSHKFDFIFFTGSTPVGKIVMQAAAKNLTPSCLELGGKSPCLVGKSADIHLAAKRICWAKFVNAGQTCVAPDYTLVHKSKRAEFITSMKYWISEFYGQKPQESTDYCRIISNRHFKRLCDMIENTEFTCGGERNHETRYISPTLVNLESKDHPLMVDEIFGPILPILTFDNIFEAIELVQSFDKPLALYLYSNDEFEKKKILSSLSFGGGCINESLVHLANPHLPFGGVGGSGIGAYHGEYSFKTFSHAKSVYHGSKLIDPPFKYPPYKDSFLKMFKKFM